MKDVRVGIYVRLSNDDLREGESMSIENQKHMLMDFCFHQGWKIIDIYADDGYTGLNFNRPQVQRLIEDAKLGKINLILVKDLSRFGRNHLECGYYHHLCGLHPDAAFLRNTQYGYLLHDLHPR